MYFSNIIEKDGHSIEVEFVIKSHKLDYQIAKDIRNSIESWPARENFEFTLDLSHVTHVDFDGISSLLSAKFIALQQNSSFRVANCQPDIEQMLAINPIKTSKSIT